MVFVETEEPEFFPLLPGEVCIKYRTKGAMDKTPGRGQEAGRRPADDIAGKERDLNLETGTRRVVGLKENHSKGRHCQHLNNGFVFEDRDCPVSLAESFFHPHFHIFHVDKDQGHLKIR